MSGHTPGPWVIWNEYNVRSASGRLVANTAGHAGNVPSEEAVRDQNEANARLISAAPDLLEALQRFIDLADAEYLGTEARAAHAVKVARSVVAKTEGR